MIKRAWTVLPVTEAAKGVRLISQKIGDPQPGRRSLPAPRAVHQSASWVRVCLHHGWRFHPAAELSQVWPHYRRSASYGEYRRLVHCGAPQSPENEGKCAPDYGAKRPGMNRPLGLFLLGVGLSILWYFSIGTIAF
jgi:hypothetical protein